MRLLLKDRRCRAKNEEKVFGFGFNAFFILAIALFVPGIDIFRRTVIELKYLVLAACLGVIVLVILLFWLKKFSLGLCKTFLLALSVGGCIPCFLLLYLNKSLANKEITSKVFAIQKTGNLANGRYGRCGIPYAAVDFEGYEKQLIFSCAYERSIHTFTRVRIDYYEGYWGFPVIQAQELVN